MILGDKEYDEFDEYDINIDGASSATTSTTARDNNNDNNIIITSPQTQQDIDQYDNTKKIYKEALIEKESTFISLDKHYLDENENENNKEYYNININNENTDYNNKNNNNSNNNSNSKEFYFNQDNSVSIFLNKILAWIYSKPRGLWNTIHCAIGFLFIFFGYNPTQSLITNIHEKDGSIGLTLIYLFFSISCFIAPSIIKKIGLIKSLYLSGFVYALFIFCSIDKLSYLFLPASCAIGFAAGLLWTAQPVYVSQNAASSLQGEKEIGIYSGIFQAINSSGGIIGNAVSGGLRTAKIQTTYILCTLGSVTVFGSSLLIFLKNVDSSTQGPKRSLKKTLISTFLVFKDKKFQLCIPLFILQGQSQSYFFQTINNLIGIERVGFISLVFGVVSVLGASLWGKVHDSKGKVVMQYILAGLYILSLVLAFVAYHFSEMPLFYVISAINGCFDSLQTILIFVTVATLYPIDNVAAFSASRFVMSISTAAAFFTFKYIPFFAVVFWLLLLLIAAQVSYTTLMKQIKDFTKLPSETSSDIIVNKISKHHDDYEDYDSFGTVNEDDKI
ncbi:hypothetical protein DICPUDRAFT_158759 [Dictyostelium purpureum]|uniref:Major facilitator superfamily (MFS) profile domain-containing protein n=1 Tax=Dictyostelium purpureum TaxID=5786 RepID=F1A2E7_DICPU|nr:uncharacterized protein DICPUDRAFT_158759 [Dictyostelium purpureum]EGC29637.1 hypothetical protein DICPUDRAFT_158759 [Dictyostelium purpureum]|eukprot:XP_003293841.1 hypothetical protein DICPUDRAFT_158759 [Dictyostelium purpureum]